MRWKQKPGVFKTIISILTVSIVSFSAFSQKPVITILAKKDLPYFTTSNGLETYKRNLVVIGNEASEMLILDTLLQVKDTFSIISNEKPDNVKQVKRIADMNTTSIVQFEGQDILLIMGTRYIKSQTSLIYLLPLNIRGRKEILIQSYIINEFFQKLRKKGLRDLNINGSSGFNKQMILAITGKNKRYNNHLVVCDVNFWQKGIATNFSIIPVKFAGESIRITGLTYVPETDWLLFSANNMDNPSHNFAGIIPNASKALKDGRAITPIELISDQDLDSGELDGSLESLSVDIADNKQVILYLLKNEPQKQSTIFRVKVQLTDALGK